MQPDPTVEQESRSASVVATNGARESAGAPAEQPDPNDELTTAAGICLICAELIQPDQDGCPNSDFSGLSPNRHPIRWFARPEPPVRFPKDDLETALSFLRRPFTPEAIRFKVQGSYKDKGCFCVAHIDARLVVERLNLVAGPFWHDEYEGTPDGLMGCRLTVLATTRYDVGEGKGKALRSDAFKRAAVKFGVGVSVYAIPRADLWWSDFGKHDGGKGYISRWQDDKKNWHYRLEAAGDEALRKRYAKWLETDAGKDFGDPIGHGDVAESAGEAPEGQDEPTASDIAPVELPLTDDKADALRVQCRAAYANVKKSALPKARFDRELASASTSHEALEALHARLTEMAR